MKWKRIRVDLESKIKSKLSQKNKEQLKVKVENYTRIIEVSVRKKK